MDKKIITRRGFLLGGFSAAALTFAGEKTGLLNLLPEQNLPHAPLIKPGRDTFGAPLDGLLQRDGTTYRDDGKNFKLIYFGTSYRVPGCAVDLAAIRQAVRQIDQDCNAQITDRFTPVFIYPEYPAGSVPRPENLENHIDAPDSRFLALKGSPEKISDIASHYGAMYFRDQRSGLIAHSRFAYLMSPEGKNLAIVMPDTPPDFIVRQIHASMRESRIVNLFNRPECRFDF